MKINIIKNIQEWDEFLSTQDNVLFTQYSAYGKFYEKQGEKFWIIGVYNDSEKLIGGSLVVSTHAKRGNFLFLPYGPIIDYNDEQVFKKLMHFIIDLARREECDFVRVSPFIDDTNNHQKLFKSNSFRKAPIHMLAETTWLLDITSDEDDLLMNMKKNHRNLIRRCLREEVRVVKVVDDKSLKRLNDLHDITAQKHNFHRFPREYINNEFNSFVNEGGALIFEAYLPDGTLDASSIIMFAGSMGAYRHSASLNIDRKLPTSYLIQWQAILETKKRGLKVYNFWGIAPNGSSKKHPFAGITHFKKGFGGYQKNLLPCQDFPLTSKYWLTYIIESLRRIRRGF